MDLGEVRAIYGIVTKGKEDGDEWVTSYQLLYSSDGNSYSYYQDENDINKASCYLMNFYVKKQVWFHYMHNIVNTIFTRHLHYIFLNTVIFYKKALNYINSNIRLFRVKAKLQ